MLARYFVRFALILVVFVAAGFVARPSYAASVPATAWMTDYTGVAVFDNVDTACSTAWQTSSFDTSRANGWVYDSYNLDLNSCRIRCTTQGICGNYYGAGLFGSGIFPASQCVAPAEASGGYCVTSDLACPAAGTVHSQGYYDVGTVPKMLANVACFNGCTVLFGGTIAAASIQDGVTHYWAHGDYVYNGYPYDNPPSASCSSGTGAAPEFTAVSSSTCAPGQNYGYVNGVKRCLNSDGTIVNTDSASAVAAVATQGEAKAQAGVDKAAAVAVAAGLDASAVVAAQSVAAGVLGASDGIASNDSVLDNFCEANPTATICVDKDYGTVEDSVLGEKTINVAITPVSVGGTGSCPAPSPMVLHGQTHYFVWTTYCNFANGIKPILLAFAWLSAAGLLIGSFKS